MFNQQISQIAVTTIVIVVVVVIAVVAFAVLSFQFQRLLFTYFISFNCIYIVVASS